MHANLPDLNVGVSASNIDVCGQCRKFLFEDFQLLASTRIPLNERVSPKRRKAGNVPGF
jgi:hypothetical protein